MRRRGRLSRTLLVGVALLLAAPASAGADHNAAFLRQASTPGGPGLESNEPAYTYPHRQLTVSDDGSRVFLNTSQSLVAADTDSGCSLFVPPFQGCIDVYELSNGVWTLVSTGPAGGNGSFNARWVANSPDGSGVFFVTAEQLTSADTDASTDVYKRSGGVTELISVGPGGGNAALSASFDAISTDGSRVFFSTAEALTADDTDSVTDVYERSGGATTLISTGPAGGNGAFAVTFGGIARGGSKVFFTTGEALTSNDTDTAACSGGCVDVYERSGSTTTRVSASSFGGNGGQASYFSGADADGSRVFFFTSEALDPADIDNTSDIYQRANGVTTRISTGPRGGNGVFSPWYRGVSDDGTRVFMQTREKFVDADTDVADDVYVRQGNTTELASIGPVGGNGGWFAQFSGASTDGSRIWFSTGESLVAEDTNGVDDIYQYSQGITTLVTVGADGQATNGYFMAASRDGRRVFVISTGQMVESDTDGGYWDVYERFNGASTLITHGPSGGNGPHYAGERGAFPTPDGSRVFFMTQESLTDSDTNATFDIYEANLGYDVPEGADTLHMSLVPMFRQTISSSQCAARGGQTGTHGAPLAFSSCNPPGYLPNTMARLGPSSSSSVEVTGVPGDPVTPADEADLTFNVAANDVRARPGGGDYDPSASPDVTLSLILRWTDTYNGPELRARATGSDLTYSVPVSCVSTADPSLGSNCSTNTTADALAPGAILEGRRTVITLSRWWLFDSGLNTTRGDGDDRMFAHSGIYVP